MRVKVRETIDFERVGDASQLTSYEVLYVGVMKAIHKLPFIAERKDRKLAEEYREAVRKEEALKEALLGRIYRVFKEGIKSRNTTVMVKSFESAIPRSSEEIFRKIIQHKEFSAYSIRILECNRDMLKAFPEIKLRFVVQERSLGHEAESD